MSPEQSVRLAGLPLSRVEEVPKLIELKPPLSRTRSRWSTGSS